MGSSGPASRCRLDEQQLCALDAEPDRGPAAHGWADQRWTLARIQQLIAGMFGVRYTVPGVWLLLRRGWSCQLPARHAVERDDGTVEVWRKEAWTRAKRSPRSPVGRSPNRLAIVAATAGSMAGTRRVRKSTESDRSSSGTPTGAPKPARPARREVTSSRPRLSVGRNGPTTSRSSTLSRMSSHRRCSLRSRVRIAGQSAPSPKPSAPPSPATWSWMASGSSAEIHQAASKLSVCRWAY